MRNFIQMIDTPGGHILVCIALIFIGAGMWKFGMPKSDELIVGATAVIFAAMRGDGSKSHTAASTPGAATVVQDTHTTEEMKP
jgi:hypothetical protein